MSPLQAERTIHFDGPCPFLLCLKVWSHNHPVCGDCGAVNYGSLFCATCKEKGPALHAAMAHDSQEILDNEKRARGVN